MQASRSGQSRGIVGPLFTLEEAGAELGCPIAELEAAVNAGEVEPTSEKQKRRRGTRAAKPAGTPQLAHPTPTTERLRARPTSGGDRKSVV